APRSGATLRTQDGRGIITCRVMRVHFGVRMAEMHHEHSDTLGIHFFARVWSQLAMPTRIFVANPSPQAPKRISDSVRSWRPLALAILSQSDRDAVMLGDPYEYHNDGNNRYVLSQQ
ncbi:MAG: hypothetical protein ACREXS_11835, partial [Gammaproteobacteria bacterium]